jgi:hypothetical protein
MLVARICSFLWVDATWTVISRARKRQGAFCEFATASVWKTSEFVNYTSWYARFGILQKDIDHSTKGLEEPRLGSYGSTTKMHVLRSSDPARHESLLSPRFGRRTIDRNPR